MSITDFTNNDQFTADVLKMKIDERALLFESLQASLALPLPEDAGAKAKVINDRCTLRDAIIKLNNEIDMAQYQWTPPPPVNLSLITDEGPPPPDWLIENWLPRNELTVFSGMGGTGKSHIMLNLACAAACGCPEAYLDTQEIPNPDRAERTMFASWEDGHASVQRRTGRIQEKFAQWFSSESVAANVIYRDMKPQGQIWIPASETGHIANRGIMSRPGHELLASCISEGVSILILDSITAVFGQDLNSAAHVRPFLNYLSAWANEKEVTILLIGHPNKTGKGGVSGSVDWHNGVRSRWELAEMDKDEEDQDTYYALIHAKANDAPEMPNTPLIRNTNGIYEIATGTSLEQKIQKAQKAYQEYHQHWANYTPQNKEKPNDHGIKVVL